jgi:hypothetical protein
MPLGPWLVQQNKKTVIKKILTHLGVYEEKNQRAPNQRAPPAVAPKYTEPVEIVPYDDGWPGYNEPVFDFKKFKDRQWIRTLKLGVNWLNMAWSWLEIARKANGSGKNNGKNG